METIAVESAPCDLYPALRSVPSGDPSLKDTTLLCAASALCCCEVAPSFSKVHGGATAESCCAAGAPAWLSATVTCALDVCVQVHPSLSPDGFADLFGGCHGVTVRKSKPHFVCVACHNAHNLCELHGGLVTLPLSPADLVATDVSTCSTCVKRATLPSEPSGQSARGRSVRSSTAGDADGGVMKWPTGGTAAAGCCTTEASSCIAEHLAISSAETTACVARSLPTVALLVRFPQRCRRALVLLRPLVIRQHKKNRLVYHASVRLVSESVQRAALTPCGDAAVLLADTFIHEAPLPTCESTSSGDASATLVLRGSHLPLHDVEQRSGTLQPLLLHLGLRGASARQHVLRSLLRSRVTGVWYRLRLLARSTSGAECCCPVVSELALYTSEGHTLVFEPLMGDTTHERLALAGSIDSSMTVIYTCTAGTHLVFSKLNGCTAASSIEVSQRRNRAVGGALLVAPPWRFADQWRHSPWFARALALSTAPSAALSGALASGERGRRGRRNHTSSVLAMSHNRGVWLLRTGSQLYVASIPTSTGAMEKHGDAEAAFTTAVKLDSSYALHDAQYVVCGGHAGFLLLCRSIGARATQLCDPTSAMNLVTVTSAAGDRFVHCSRPQSSLQLLFLSLTGMGTATAASDGAISPLLLVPLISSSTLASLPLSFANPSSRLRFVCAVSAVDTPGSVLATENLSDTLYAAISSSGDARYLWTVMVRLPSVWPSCTSLLQLCPGEYGGVAGGAGVATGGACRATSTLQWTAHALSALFPHACLMVGDDVVTAWRAAVQDTTASSLRRASPSSAADKEKAWLLETALEAALLELNYPYRHRDTAAAAAVSDVSLGRGPRADGTASYYPAGTIAFHDTLHALLHACFCGDAACTAGVVAVFAGFSTALRMNGLLVGYRDCPVASDVGVVATMRVVAFLHGCALLLRHAIEDVAAMGDVSALLACASHLNQTLASSAARKSPFVTTPTAWEVWTLLLQPLFDFVWGVVQAYGASTGVTAGLLECCSPATRSMAHARKLWWPYEGNAVHDTKLSEAALLKAPGEVPPSTGPAPHLAAAVLSAEHGGAAPPSVPRTPVPAAVSLSPVATAAAATSSYTNAELYEVVRRVFLMQGTSAALRLLDELQRHESTKAGVAEVAQMLEAMQRRLQGLHL